MDLILQIPFKYMINQRVIGVFSFIFFCTLLILLSKSEHFKKEKVATPLYERPKYLTDVSTLVIDLNNDGPSFSHNRAYWDINEDDMAESTSWITPEDGFLVIINKNEDLNSQKNFFGNKYLNGFEDLRKHDINRDGLIDQSDEIFNNLVIWQDVNKNGIKENTDVTTSLNDHNIKKIQLDYEPISIETMNSMGRNQSSIIYTNGATTKIYDVNFEYSQWNTVYNNEYKLDLRTLFLPNYRGYGKIPDLHIGMSLDEAAAKQSLINIVQKAVNSYGQEFNTKHTNPGRLIKQVTDIATKDIISLLDPAYDLEEAIANIMFWHSGIYTFNPYNRGPNLDARKLVYLEKFLGSSFKQRGAGGAKNPLFWASAILEQTFRKSANHTAAILVMQSGGQEIFKTKIKYNLNADTFRYESLALNKGILGQTINLVKQQNTEKKRKKVWRRYLTFIEHSVGVEKLDLEDKFLIMQAIKNTLRSDTLVDVLNGIDTINPKTLQGYYYAEEFLELNYNDPLINIFKQARNEDKSQQVVFGTVIYKHMKKRSENAKEAMNYLKSLGFVVADGTVEYNKNYKRYERHDQVIRAYMNPFWSRVYKKFGWNYDQYFIELYYDEDHLDWGYAHIQNIGFQHE